MTMSLSWRTRGPGFAGLLLSIPIAVHAAAPDFNLPSTHELRPVLIPGHYACMDGKAPTSEFDILDGTAYFMRGSPMRAGEFSYDKPTHTIRWLSGPFAEGKITGYNTTRLADKRPAIVLKFDGEATGVEFCTIVD